MTRTVAFDPRTIAREIPGLFDAVLPQLTPSVVSAFNQSTEKCGCTPISTEDVSACKLQHAMLFEVGFAAAEMLLTIETVDWDICVEQAIERQRRYFDAQIPESIPDHDREVALCVGENLAAMLNELGENRCRAIVLAPSIPGFQWIASGRGDFAMGETLVEVKCTARNFSAPDYRQLAMYWLLSYSHAIESNDQAEWSEGILLNPRSANFVAFRFDDFLRVVSGGRTKVEILELFTSIVGAQAESR